jgi:decaprenylphospho-beta-D-erythro-pentofuranosid-2-ulose 2-reductase
LPTPAPGSVIGSGSASVLIVGAASDIGQAIARAYARSGRRLVLAARQPERLEADATDLRLRTGVEVKVVAFDILQTESHAAMLDGLGTLPTTVVSVVGLLGDQARSEADPVQADLVMRTNYLAPALFLGEVANRMQLRGSGTIIGISSVAGERGRAANYVYGSAKAGFTAFLSGLRNRLYLFNVHVVTVKPGFVDTKMTEGMKLPAALTVKPDVVASSVMRAEQIFRDTIYVSRKWWLIMTVIRLLPEGRFKRMKI